MTDLVLDPGVQGLIELGRNSIDRVTELEALTENLSDLLKRSIIAILGPEPELTAWGYHDLPDRCQQLMAELAHARADIERLSVDLEEARDRSGEDGVTIKALLHLMKCVSLADNIHSAREIASHAMDITNK